MHGRIYDPVLAEFLTPDPLMPNPSGRGVNAFSYVENQPLDFTDPSGFTPFDAVDIGFDNSSGIFRPAAYGYSFGDDALQGFAPAASSAASTGGGISSYLADSVDEASVAADGAADVASTIGSAASYVASAVSAAVAAHSFLKHLNNDDVHRRPVPQSKSARAPSEGSGAPHVPSGTSTQTRTDPSGSSDRVSDEDLKHTQSALDPQRPVENRVLNQVKTDDAHELLDGFAHGLFEVVTTLMVPEAKAPAVVEELAEALKLLKAAERLKGAVIEGFKLGNHAFRKGVLGKGATAEIISSTIRGARGAGTVTTETAVGKFAGNKIEIFVHNGVKVVTDSTRGIIMSVQNLAGFRF